MAANEVQNYASQHCFAPLISGVCLAGRASGNASKTPTQGSKAQPARLEPSSTVDCNQQTWPIINAACLHSASNTAYSDRENSKPGC
jgi:hypothetical protein